ncbi:hypothetical protein [Streptomyces sp. WAC04114]|uniref:hypothetical protein n=1 Tax=Streptomyces sp. WAC04114 TaxID=2867961 RepID=UPI001C8B8E93|nr:hypothetical protein [Streptomyces sp. WAC04114]MBX9363927.1 hypothetical protein [Streptomyces sp. WAC04114]
MYDLLELVLDRGLGDRRVRVGLPIESFYCRPGIEGAHEKGTVEGQIGYFRRNHFVPMLEVAGGAD